MHQNWIIVTHQLDCKNGCHGKYSFRGFGRNLLNRIMNILKAGSLLQSLENFITFFGMRLIAFILAQQSKFPSITKKN